MKYKTLLSRISKIADSIENGFDPHYGGGMEVVGFTINGKYFSAENHNGKAAGLCFVGEYQEDIQEYERRHFSTLKKLLEYAEIN